MRVLFTKSFAKDLRKHKKNRRILNQVQKIIENDDHTMVIIKMNRENEKEKAYFKSYQKGVFMYAPLTSAIAVLVWLDFPMSVIQDKVSKASIEISRIKFS